MCLRNITKKLYNKIHLNDDLLSLILLYCILPCCYFS